jgi:hypothetical protein
MKAESVVIGGSFQRRGIGRRRALYPAKPPRRMAPLPPIPRTASSGGAASCAPCACLYVRARQGMGAEAKWLSHEWQIVQSQLCASTPAHGPESKVVTPPPRRMARRRRTRSRQIWLDSRNVKAGYA